MPYTPTDYLTDGFSTLLGLTLPATTMYAETEVTPAAVVGGGGIDQTSMRSDLVRSQLPKALYGHGDITVRVAYDPAIQEQLELAAINVNQTMGIRFPDNQGYLFFGWIDNFAPDGLTEGNRPTAMMTIKVSNVNDTTGEEEPPTYVSDLSANALFA
jgi:hypothetical protein